MKYKLKIYSIWEYGQRVDSEGRPHQEDSLFPAYGQQRDTDRLFILCDGMGGHAAGEVASATVCEAMSRSVLGSVPDPEGDFSDENLQTAVDDAFRALAEVAGETEVGEKKMGTTMTFLKFHSQGCTIAHMGDSRVYHIRPGKGREDSVILFQTSDHSLVNDLIKVGELTPEEARHSRQKNIITRAMQPNPDRQPRADVYHTADIRPGDWFYLCSDGMLEEMDDDNLLFNFSEATGDDANKVKILTQATSQNRDNHTAIIVHVMEVIDPLPAGEEPVPAPVAGAPEPIMAEIGKAVSDTPSGEKEASPCAAAATSPDVKRNPISRPKGKQLVKYIVSVLLFLLVVGGIYKIASDLSGRKAADPARPAAPVKSDAVPQPQRQETAPAPLQSDGHARPTGGQSQPDSEAAAPAAAPPVKPAPAPASTVPGVSAAEAASPASGQQPGEEVTNSDQQILINKANETFNKK